jgi:MarR family transcriptional regulator, organic hydroperoxide resistance regulator
VRLISNLGTTPTGSVRRVANDFLLGYLPYLLQRADQLLSDRFHRELAAEGVAVSDWRILAVLRDDIARGISDLAAETLLPQPTCTHAVARLEAGGYVRRARRSKDGRRVEVSLTAAGRRFADGLIARAERSTADAIALLDPALATNLRAHTQALIHALNEPAN